MPALLSLLLVLLSQLLTPSALAANAPSHERLSQMKKEIGKLEQSVVLTSRERNAANDALRDAELRIGSISQQQQKLRQQLQTTQKRYQVLQAQQQQLLASKQQQITALEALVRQRYAEGQEARLKLLLNQQDPDQVARLMEYQHYFEQARSARIQTLNANLKTLADVSQQLLTTQQQLTTDNQALASRRADMQQVRNQRHQLLTRLNASLSNKQQHLNQLRANSQRLEKLLDSMQQSVISDIPANLGKQPFATLATKLPWPLPGKLEAHYRDIVSGDVRWDGVVIAANQGDPVRAIYPGRVIYADWLPGYGLMIIIDQGRGYMTLYGYNENLTRKVGDWVSAGDTIAHAGDSGGRRNAGLYFGIRHNGKPVNPEQWCNRRVTLPPIASH